MLPRDRPGYNTRVTKISADLKSLRHAAYARARGRCEITGAILPGGPDGDWALHHRRLKGMGGTNRADTHTLPNVLALTHRVHNLARPSVHLDPAWAKPRGYLLSTSTAHPGLHPVLLHGRLWVVLGMDGDYLDSTGT
jgi:hypothetical protein